MIKQTVLNLVKPIAQKNNCQASLEAINKPKFELPKLTKWGIANVKGYSTYEAHKNPWFQGQGMGHNPYGGGFDRHFSGGNFHRNMRHLMDHIEEIHNQDQPHPSIVQAAQCNDLENVRRLIKHALGLPESEGVSKNKIPKKFTHLSAERQKEIRKLKKSNQMMKKQTEENVVTFKKFTSREQALNIARFTNEEEQYEDNALHAAIREGNDHMVQILLEAGADPTLKTSVKQSGNVQNPIGLAHQLKLKSHSSARVHNNIEMMLTVALEFWDEASYSSVRAGSSGASRNWTNVNKCKDFDAFQNNFKAVTEFCSWEPYDVSE